MEFKGQFGDPTKILAVVLLIGIIVFILLFITRGPSFQASDAIKNMLGQSGEKVGEQIQDTDVSGQDGGSGGLFDSSGSSSGTSSGSSSGGSGAGTGSSTAGDIAGGPAAIGGGEAYTNKVCQDQADITVQDASIQGLQDAFSSASSGDIVFIPPDMEIDMGHDERMDIPQGVTLAGGRGCNGQAGALLYSDDIVKDDYDEELMFAISNSDVRMTGLRIRGPHGEADWFDPDHYADGNGVSMGSNTEFDNNEIFGFAGGSVGGGSNAHVHHNYIHHNSRKGLGYGVTGADDSIIEYNHFNHNRHSVAGSGDESYEARYNYVGPRSISHIFDMHEPGGETIKIHHNTVTAVEQDDDNKNTPAVTIRGTPSDVADIHHNWIYNTEDPCASPGSWPGCAVLQTQHGQSSFQNVNVHDNHYGEDEPGCDIGAPREGCGSQ